MSDDPFEQDQKEMSEAADWIFGVEGDDVAGKTYMVGGDESDMVEWDDSYAGWHILCLEEVNVDENYVSKSSGVEQMKIECHWRVVSKSKLNLGVIHPEKSIPDDDPFEGGTVRYDTYYVQPKTFFIFNNLCKALNVPWKEHPTKKTKKGNPIKVYMFDPEKVRGRCVIAYLMQGTKGQNMENPETGKFEFVEVPSGYADIADKSGRRMMQPIYEDKEVVGDDLPF